MSLLIKDGVADQRWAEKFSITIYDRIQLMVCFYNCHKIYAYT